MDSVINAVNLKMDEDYAEDYSDNYTDLDGKTDYADSNYGAYHTPRYKIDYDCKKLHNNIDIEAVKPRKVVASQSDFQ